MIDLKTEFLDRTNILLIHRVREAIDKLYESKVVPLQLEIATAKFGLGRPRHDHGGGGQREKTDFITKFLSCIALLLVIYRAPILAFIPLLTVGITVPLAVHLLLIMAKYNLAGMFTELETYIVVVVYGAGIDYCLFPDCPLPGRARQRALLSRRQFRLRWRRSAAHPPQARDEHLRHRDDDVRRVRQVPGSGLRDLVRSPDRPVQLSHPVARHVADLRPVDLLAGCPQGADHCRGAGSRSPPSAGLSRRSSGSTGCGGVSDSLDRHPGKIFLGSILLMLPFAIVGIAKQRHLSYGLLTDLPQTYASVEGARAIQLHFPAGMARTTTVLIRDDNLGLKTKDSELDAAGMRAGREISRYLEDYLISHKEAACRSRMCGSQFSPLGVENSKALRAPGPAAGPPLQSYRNYASLNGPEAGKVLRMDIVYEQDPFSRESFDLLTRTEDAIRTALAGLSQGGDGERRRRGPTPRDLRRPRSTRSARRRACGT